MVKLQDRIEEMKRINALPAVVARPAPLAAADATPAPSNDDGRPRPPRTAVAPLRIDTRYATLAMLGILENKDPTTALQRPKDKRTFDYRYGSHDERLFKDAHLLACVMQRVKAVLSHPMMVQPADESNEAADVAAFVEASFKQIDYFRGGLAELLMAFYYGFAVVEVLWPTAPQPIQLRYKAPVAKQPGSKTAAAATTTVRPAILPRELVGRHPYRFVFDENNNLRLLTLTQPVKGLEVDEALALIRHTPHSRFGNPYGPGVASTTDWWSRFLTDDVSWWQIFNEKFASPTPLAIYKKGSRSDREIAELRTLVTSIQQQTGITVDDDVALSLLEASRTGTVSTYEKFCLFCEQMISKAVLGQTLTVQIGDTGSYSAAEVHLAVRQDIIEDDAIALCECINRKLIPMIVEVNYGAAARHLYPTASIDTDPPEDVEKVQKVFSQALTDGVPVSLSDYYKRCRLKEPSSEEDTLHPTRLNDEPQPFDPSSVLPVEPGKGAPGFGKPAPGKAALRTDPKLTAKGEVQLPLASGKLRAAEGGGIEDALPDKALLALYREGVERVSEALSGLPEHVREQILERAAELYGAGFGDTLVDMLLDAPLPSLPDDFKDPFVDSLNDDLTIAHLTAHEQVIEAIEKAGHSPRSLPADYVPPKVPSLNPVIEPLFGKERIIPTRVMSVFTRKVHNSLTHDAFYQLDALSRSASFTAWDLLEADVRHIGGALQDAIHHGWTCQQFADHVYDRLEAKYVIQGSELHAWHVETIYHTNLAAAYNTATADELWASKETFPYYRFSNPNPQYPACVERAGKVYSIEQLRAAGVPPLHFHCGSWINALTAATVERLGLRPELQLPATSPMVYAGPKDPVTGVRVGNPQPFGAWAPPEERFEHLKNFMGGLE